MIGQTLKDRYKVIARLGKGAMGTVYRATDLPAGQDVALKIISSDLVLESEILERFKREGEALAKLRHPNIVGFMDAFPLGEQYVIVMEYVPGGSLYDLIKTAPLPVERACQITLDLCDALIRAHRLNIVHRDLKPENILIDADGTPKLADFGVARLSEGTRMTRSGTQVGTPYYMSPEAWEGKGLDAQADVWSLGVILFEMLAGQLPFDGDTPLSVMNKINTMSPPDLKKLRADVPSGLVKIIGRMLTRNRKRRYSTMREVAVELERVQVTTNAVENRREQQKAISARISSARSELFNRSKQIVSTAAPYIKILGSVGLFFTLVWGSSKVLPSVITSSSPPANTGLPSLTETIIQTPRVEPGQGSTDIAVTSNPTLPPDPETISVNNVSRLVELDRLGLGIIRSSAWAEDARALILATSTGIYRIDPATGEVTVRVDSLRDEVLLAVAADAGVIATSSGVEESIRIWDGDTGELRNTLEMGYPVEQLALSRDGSLLAAAWNEPVGNRIKNGRIFIWNVEAGEVVTEISAGARLMEFSPDGQLLITGNGNNDTAIKFWNSNDGLIVNTIPVGQADGLVRYHVSGSGKYLAWYYNDVDYTRAGGRDECGCPIYEQTTNRYFRVWDLEKNSALTNLAASSEFIIDENGPSIVYSTVETGENADQRTSFWYIDFDGGEATKLQEIAGSVEDYMITPGATDLFYYQVIEGQMLAGHLNLETGSASSFVIGDQLNAVDSMAMSADGEYLATAGTEYRVSLWDLNDASRLDSKKLLEGGSYSRISSLDFDSTGKKLAGGTTNGDVLIWDLETGAVSNVPISPAPQGPIESLDFNRDDSLLAIAGLYTYIPGRTEPSGGKAVVVDLALGKVVESFRSNGLIRRARFFGDGNALAFGTGYPDNMIQIWNQLEGIVSEMDYRSDDKAGDASLTMIAFDPGGRYLLAGYASKDGLYIDEAGPGVWQIWDLSNSQMASSGIAEGAVLAGTFNPAGDLFAVAGTDRTVRIFDRNTSELLISLAGHASGITELIFSPDGTRLYSSSIDGTVRVWGIR